jgi:hypothetical protein
MCAQHQTFTVACVIVHMCCCRCKPSTRLPAATSRLQRQKRCRPWLPASCSCACTGTLQCGQVRSSCCSTPLCPVLMCTSRLALCCSSSGSSNSDNSSSQGCHSQQGIVWMKLRLMQQQQESGLAVEGQPAGGTSSSLHRRSETSLQKECAPHQQQEHVQQGEGHNWRASAGSKAAMDGNLQGQQPLQRPLQHQAALGSCSPG